MCCRQWLFRLWPPYEARVANRELSEAIESADYWESIKEEVNQALSKGNPLEDVAEAANKIQDYEIARKDGLENKALVFSTGISIAAGVMSVLPVLFSNKWGIPETGAIVAGTVYLIAIIHLWIAAYYGVLIRQIQGLARPSATSLINELNDEDWDSKQRVLTVLSNVKWNENYLLLKSNYLSVAEKMFLRGLAFIAVAAVTAVILKLLVEYNILSPNPVQMIICQGFRV